MITDIRRQYNQTFTDQKYASFFESLWQRFHQKIEFKVCETPVFIPAWLKDELIKAGEEVIDFIVQPGFKQQMSAAIPSHLVVPGEDERTTFLAIDFGICQDEAGNIVPQLIEMQGFASLYGHQHAMAKAFKQHFDIPSSLNHLFGLDNAGYEQLLRDTLLGEHRPENVVLMDIQPNQQKTWVDFWDTKEISGIEPICISDIHKEGKDLYYIREGKKTPIYRIYNRLIFDELEQRKDLKLSWNMTEEAQVEWVSHPNWFFYISKYTIPFIQSRYIPETRFLSDVKQIPSDLENYVLKPLFSFAGSGVKFDVTLSDIEQVVNPEHFLLQRKVNYAPVIETPDDPAKFEVRLMYIWKPGYERPTLVINLVRLSKGKMIGVNFNKNRNWVGGSVGFFE